MAAVRKYSERFCVAVLDEADRAPAAQEFLSKSIVHSILWIVWKQSFRVWGLCKNEGFLSADWGMELTEARL